MAWCRRIVLALIAASTGLLVVSASAWAYQFTLGNVRSHGYVLSGSGDDFREPLGLELVRKGKHSVETVTFTVARAKVRDGGGCSLHVRGRFGRYGEVALTIRPRTSCTEIAPNASRRAVATGVLVLAIPGGGFTIRLSRLPARVFNPGPVCGCLLPPLTSGACWAPGRSRLFCRYREPFRRPMTRSATPSAASRSRIRSPSGGCRGSCSRATDPSSVTEPKLRRSSGAGRTSRARPISPQAPRPGTLGG